MMELLLNRFTTYCTPYWPTTAASTPSTKNHSAGCQFSAPITKYCDTVDRAVNTCVVPTRPVSVRVRSTTCVVCRVPCAVVCVVWFVSGVR